jgi:hypothetical protein
VKEGTNAKEMKTAKKQPSVKVEKKQKGEAGSEAYQVLELTEHIQKR